MEPNAQDTFERNVPPSYIEEGKTIAIIAYITLIGLIVAFIMNNEKKNPFASYHIRQSLGIGLTGLAISIIGYIPILGWIISLFGSILILILWIMGLISAINGEERPVPILGVKYQEWLSGI